MEPRQSDGSIASDKGPWGAPAAEGDGTVPRISLKRRALAALALFAAGFAAVMGLRNPLLSWLVGPLRGALSAVGIASPELHVASTTEFFTAILHLAAWAGLLASGPLLTLQVATWVAPRTFARANAAVLWFVLPAYAALVAGVVLALTVPIPDFLSDAFRKNPGLETAGVPTIAFGDYLALVSIDSVLCAFCAEFSVVLFFLTQASVSRGKSWPILPWLGFCMVATLVSILVTPLWGIQRILVPMLGLYVLAIVAAVVLSARARQ